MRFIRSFHYEHVSDYELDIPLGNDDFLDIDVSVNETGSDSMQVYFNRSGVRSDLLVKINLERHETTRILNQAKALDTLPLS